VTVIADPFATRTGVTRPTLFTVTAFVLLDKCTSGGHIIVVLVENKKSLGAVVIQQKYG
jgi:hypothetical protein